MGEAKNSLVRIPGKPNAHLYKLGDVFWVRASRTGKKRLQQSLNTTQILKAREMRDQLIAQYHGIALANAPKGVLVEDKFPEFLELKRTKAKATYNSIENQWRVHLKEGFGHLLLSDISESVWLRYVAKKRIEHPERKFFNDRKYLSMFLHWLYRDGLIPKIPRLPDVDPEIAEGKVYTAEQIKKLLEKSTKDLNLQIRMAVTMGMRVGEIMSLEWTQIDFQKKLIYLPAEKTKIRKERTFGISQACFDDLADVAKKSEGLAVFPAPGNPDKTQGRDGNKRAWTSCKRMAGIPKEYRFHWLRHTFLTNAFKRSVNPALICEYAGLSLEEAQKTYLHFTVEDTRVVASLVGVEL